MTPNTARTPSAEAVDRDRRLSRLSVLTFIAVASLLAFLGLASAAASRGSGLLAAAFLGLAVSSLLLLGRVLLSALSFVRDEVDDVYWLPPEAFAVAVALVAALAVGRLDQFAYR